MSPRAIRRAMERKAAKLARKKGVGPEITNSGIGGRTFAELHAEIEQADARMDAAWAESGTNRSNGGPLKSRAAGDGACWDASEDRSPRDSESKPRVSNARPAAPQVPNRAASNKVNAQFSTGPTSAEGKAKCSLNAVKSGLTGHTVLLPTDDVALYQQHLADYAGKWKPVGPFESALVQSIADSAWRLQRIPALEFAIYSVGYRECVAALPEGEPLPDRGLIDLHTFTKHEKNLRNLQLQESRLRRHQEKDREALEALQSTRIAEEKASLQSMQDVQLEAAAQRYLAAKSAAQPHGGIAGPARTWTPADDGFVFSIDEIERYISRRSLAKAASHALKFGGQPAPIGVERTQTDQLAA